MADTATEPKKKVVTVDLTPEVYQRLAERAQLSSPAAMPAADDPGLAAYQQNVDLTEGRISDLARRAMGAAPQTDVAQMGADAGRITPAGAKAGFPDDQVWGNVER